MLNVSYDENFLDSIRKIRDTGLKRRIIKQVEKIIENPSIRKPMRYVRKGTRELYISPYRISSAYIKNQKK